MDIKEFVRERHDLLTKFEAYWKAEQASFRPVYRDSMLEGEWDKEFFTWFLGAGAPTP